MRKVDLYRLNLKKLEDKISKVFTSIRKKYPVIPFITPEMCDDYCDDYYEVRNDINGGVFDVYITSITESGIECIKSSDTTEKLTIGIYDLSDIRDRLNLLDSIEDQIIKINTFIWVHGIKVERNEPAHYVELMMDNHKCIKWGKKQYYICEDTNYVDGDEVIYDLLVEFNHV